jgi:hypothetical protein
MNQPIPRGGNEPLKVGDRVQIVPEWQDRLVDNLSPGMRASPSGNFCLLMSLRFTEETVTEDAASETTTPEFRIAARSSAPSLPASPSVD